MNRQRAVIKVGDLLHQRRISARTILYVVLAFLCATGASSTGFMRPLVGPDWKIYEFLARIALLTAAIILGSKIYKRLLRNLADREPYQPAVASQPSVKYLQDLQSRAAKHLEETFTKESVVTFVSLMTAAPRHQSRVVETVQLEERVATRRVSIEFSLPFGDSDKGHARYIPLFSPRKGQMVDNLQVFDAAGKPIPDLSFEESTELVTAGLRLLLQQSTRPPGDGGAGQSDALPEKLRELELILLGQLTRRGYVDPGEAQTLIGKALETYQGSLAQGEKELTRYVEALSFAYPIIAVVPPESIATGKVILRYERTLIPAALNERGLGWVRVVLGLRPNRVVVPADMASTAGSYHLYLVGPASMYVLDQRFRCRKCLKNVSRDWVPSLDGPAGCFHRSVGTEAADGGRRSPTGVPQFDGTNQQYRITSRRGQNFVHLYTRGFGEGEATHFRNLELFARFKETPPGSRASAVVTAVVATFLIWIMGNLASDGSATLGSLPGLVLALPAAAATWFGFSTDSKSLVGTSLLSRISQIVTALVSAVAIAVYFTSHHGHIPHGLTIIGVTEPLWVILLLISAFNLAYVSYRFALKIRIYNDLLRKEDRHGHSGQDTVKV